MTVFIVLTILSGILEMTYVGTSEQNTLSQAVRTLGSLKWDIIRIIPSAVIAAGVVVRLIFAALFWDYSFWTGTWNIVRWAFFFPISVGFVFSVVFAIRGTSSG
jgi:uncharacterized membrane-anchored protein YitT (DUF2179 family)